MGVKKINEFKCLTVHRFIVFKQFVQLLMW